VKPLRSLQAAADARSGSLSDLERQITAAALRYRLRPSFERHRDLAAAVTASLRAAGHGPSLRRGPTRA
jgi:hypothetical protein